MPFTDAGAAHCLGGFESGQPDRGPQGEAERVFGAAEDLMQRAMEADTETGYLEVRYDPASQRRTHTYLNERYAALRGASRLALLARLAAHTADLPAPPPDFLAALLHALLRRRAATCTQHVRAACGGRGALLWEHSRKRFDGDGRVVKVRAADVAYRRAYFDSESMLTESSPSAACFPVIPPHQSVSFCRRVPLTQADVFKLAAQVTTAVREISPADYDAALRAAPDDCPLLCVAGDRRSGAELLAGLDADARHAARAVGSASWARQLDRLAAELGPRLAQA